MQDSVAHAIAALRALFPGGHEQFIPRSVEDIILHAAKNRDYASGGDPLGNFKRVAGILAQYPRLDLANPEVIALVYMLKQLDAALWMIAGEYDGKVETVQARLADVSVYAKLVAILREENTVIEATVAEVI